jgi:outer membrane protein
MRYLMQLRLGGLVRAGLVLAVGMLAAQAAAAEVKVGFVDVRKVMELAPQSEEARNSIEKEFAPRDRELLQQQKEVRSLEDRLVKNAAVLSEVERQRKETDIRASKRELRRAQDEFREDLNLRRSQELSKIQQTAREVIQKFAKAEKYDLIVSEGVVFAGKRVDITDKILERLRADFKSSSQ